MLTRKRSFSTCAIVFVGVGYSSNEPSLAGLTSNGRPETVVALPKSMGGRSYPFLAFRINQPPKRKWPIPGQHTPHQAVLIP